VEWQQPSTYRNLQTWWIQHEAVGRLQYIYIDNVYSLTSVRNVPASSISASTYQSASTERLAG